MSPKTPTSPSRAKRVGRTSAVALGSGAMLVTGSGALLLSASPASANPILSVSNLNDSGQGSLRSAINDANGTVGADVIQFDPGLTGTITLASDLPNITESITVNGLDAVTIDGGWRDGGATGHSVFQVYAATGAFSFNDVTITGGNATHGGAVGFVNSSGDLTISSSTITGNYSNNGAVTAFSPSIGSLTVTDTTVSNNQSGNVFPSGSGGVTVIAALTSFPVTVTNSIFDANVGYEGGALYLQMQTADRATITGSTFTNNHSSTEGGAFHLALGSVTIADSTFTGNSTDGSGGALYLDGGDNVITDSVFTNNTANFDGGAMRVSQGMSIDNTTISGNSAASGSGGAISTDGDLDHGLDVRNSTISNNTASVNGGGIVNRSVGSLTVENSTIASNVATAGSGGAIFGSSGGLVLTADTITQNSAAMIDGVDTSENLRGPTTKPANANLLQLDSTILAGNGTSDIGESIQTNSTVKSDHSIIGTSTVTLTDLGGTQTGVTGAALLLGPLTNNGGPTNTFALLAGSPAIDTGMAALPAFTGNDFDQRGTGFVRIYGTKSDIGAFEVQPDPPVTTTTTTVASGRLVTPAFAG